MTNQCVHGSLMRVCPICELQAEVEELRAEVEALREDAERYRKWRSEYTNHDSATANPDYFNPMLVALADAWTPDEVDAAIDEALAARSGEKG